jgi:ethanolamine ammonia-lyase large subunit
MLTCMGLRLRPNRELDEWLEGGGIFGNKRQASREEDEEES